MKKNSSTTRTKKADNTFSEPFSADINSYFEISDIDREKTKDGVKKEPVNKKIELSDSVKDSFRKVDFQADRVRIAIERYEAAQNIKNKEFIMSNIKKLIYQANKAMEEVDKHEQKRVESLKK
jgi:D-hexose-6-phosphate mutarotase